MAVKANGQLYLTAEEQYERYRITCSAGDTIALGADGTAKAQVVLGFYRLGTDGVMEAFAPERLVYEVRAADGGVLYDDAVAPGGATYDVTGDMRGDMASLWAEIRTAEGSVLAVQSFGVVRDGADGEPGKPGDAGADGVTWDVRLSCGEAVYATAYAELKGGVTAELTKDGAVTEMYAMDVDWQDANEASIYKYRQGGGEGLTKYVLTDGFTHCIGLGKAPYRLVLTPYAYDGAARPAALLEKTFAVAYDTARPIGRGGWEAGATYRNGEMVMVGDVVYMWNYPVSGNSQLSPKEDVAQNPQTTHWLARQEEVLLATKVLLAAFALVGGAVFMGDYVVSRYGTAGGSASEDYTTFDEDDPDDADGSGSFAPTLWMDFATGEIHLGAGRVAGFRITGESLTNEGFENNARIMFRNNAKGLIAALGGSLGSMLDLERFVGWFENREERMGFADRNTALKLRASGAAVNDAFNGEGNGVLDGMVCGWKANVVRVGDGTAIDYSKGNYVLATCYPGGDGLLLPTLNNMRTALGVNGTEKTFAAELTIVSHISTVDFRVVGRKGTTGQSTQMPSLRNGSADDIEQITLGSGDTARIMLVWDGNGYYAYASVSG